MWIYDGFWIGLGWGSRRAGFGQVLDRFRTGLGQI